MRQHRQRYFSLRLGRNMVAGGKADEDITAAVVPHAAHARQPYRGALCQALALHRQQRRISGKHNNNGTLCRGGFVPGRRYALHVQRAPHGHSIHAQQMACAIIGLHQRAQRVSVSASAHHAR